MSPPRRTLRAAGGGILAAGTALLAAEPAAAHGLSGQTDLPVPTWLFAWAAALVLIASFAALGLLWPRPRLERPRVRPLFAIPGWVRPLGGVVGVALYAAVVYSGLAGTSVPSANLAPTAIYVAFWVGIPLLSLLLGDVFALLSPWRAVYRWLSGAARRLSPSLDAAPLAYPARLGYWPAVAGLAAFGWVELVYVDGDDPATLAALALAYGLVQVVGMSVYGERAWSERADGFGVWFSLCARLSPLEVRDRRLCRRLPLSGAPRFLPLPGAVALLCVVIGTTTFDGASAGELWVDVAPDLQDAFASLGLGATAASELAFTVGQAAAIALVAALYWAGIRGVRTLDPRRGAGELARTFAHTLVPIAVAYALAHYVSLLVFQGQALAYLVSDPLGTGANLLGTADAQVDYAVVSPNGIWYLQVAALVAGHVAALALAHDRALATFAADAHAAARSQQWMLAVMVGFTCLGLWLLSAVNA